jgi:hypothetical protein
MAQIGKPKAKQANKTRLMVLDDTKISLALPRGELLMTLIGYEH